MRHLTSILQLMPAFLCTTYIGYINAYYLAAYATGVRRISEVDLFIHVFILAWFIGIPLLYLSQVGSYFVDRSFGVRKPTTEEQTTLDKIYAKLRDRGHVKLPKWGYRFVIKKPDYHDDLDAFAYGNNTIAFTPVFFEFDEDITEGIMAHEIAHHRYLDIRMNILILVFWRPYLLIANFLLAIARCFSEFPYFTLVTALLSLAISLPYSFLNWLESFTSQSKEFKADAFAIKATQHEGIIEFFKAFDPADEQKYIFIGNFTRSHPPMHKRVEFSEKLLYEIRAGATAENEIHDAHEIIVSPEVEKRNEDPAEIHTVERMR